MSQSVCRLFSSSRQSLSEAVIVDLKSSINIDIIHGLNVVDSSIIQAKQRNI